MTRSKVEVQVYAHIRTYQLDHQGHTCELLHKEIGELAEDEGGKRICRSEVTRAINGLLEAGYLVNDGDGLRCCMPCEEGLVDAFYHYDDKVGYRTVHPDERDVETCGEVGNPDPPRGESPLLFDSEVGKSHRSGGESPPTPIYNSITPSTPNADANLEGSASSDRSEGGGEDFQNDLVRELVERGVTESNPSACWDARRLVAQFSGERIAKQIRHFDFETSEGRPHTGGWLVQAITQAYPLPRKLRRSQRRSTGESRAWEYDHEAGQLVRVATGRSPP